MKTVYYFILQLIFFLGGCTETLDRNLGGNYLLTGYGINTEILKHYDGGGDDEILLGEIVDYSYNDNYILVYREISDKVMQQFGDHSNSEIMRGGDSIQYWIIEKQNDNLIGPLKRNEYLLKRKELNIPNSLQLVK